MSGTRKVSFNMNTKAIADVESLAAERGSTLTAVLVSAVQTEWLLSQAATAGKRILIDDAGDRRELVFMR